MPKLAKRSGLWAAAAIAAAGLALHAPLLRGQALVGWDVAELRAPWRGVQPSAWNPLALDPVLIELPHAELFHERGAPAWNPYTSLGERVGQFNWPFPAYPPAAVLYRAFPPWLAQGLHSLLHLIGAGLAALGWLRWRGHGWRAALAGALAWELSTFSSLWLEASFFHSPLAPWAVLAVWGAEALARSKRPALPCLATGLALGAAVLAGHPQLLALLVLCVLGLVAVQAWRRLGWALLALVLGACLGAPRLLPLALEFFDGHRLAPPSWAEHLDATVRLGPRHLLLAICPDLLGHPVRGFNLLGSAQARYANHQEVRLYLGLPVLILAVAGSFQSRTRRISWLTVGAVVLAFPTPFAWLLARIPGLSSSSPARVLWLVHLLVPALVAEGWRRLARRDTRLLWLTVGAVAATAGAGVLASTPWGAGLLTPPGRGDPALVASLLAPWSRGLQGEGLPGLVNVSGGGREALLLAPTLGPLLLAGFSCVLMALAIGDPRRRRRRLASALLAGLLAGELLREGLVYNPTSSPGVTFPETFGVHAAQGLTGRHGRAVLERGVAENSLMPFEIRTVGGYGSMHPRRLVTFLEALGCSPGRQLVQAAQLPEVWRQALDVRAVVGPPDSEPTVPGGLTLAWSGADCWVWQQADPLPRARVYPLAARREVPAELAATALKEVDPRAQVLLESESPRVPTGTPGPPLPATLVEDDPERVVVSVDAPQGGVLVLADAFAPGWTATGPDGQALTVEPAFVALRGVTLPAGCQGEVTFSYRAPGSRWGLWLGLLTLAGVGAAWRRLRAS